MNNSAARQFRLVRVYMFVSAAASIILAGFVIRSQSHGVHIPELTVERLNIVEPDGHLRLVLSNRPRSPGPIYQGKPFGGSGGDRAGMVFYNDEGTENGGLSLAGWRDSLGFHAIGHFAFDQFNSDQVAYLQYQDDNGTRLAGLTIADRADENLADWARRADSVKRLADGPAKTAAMDALVGLVNGVPRFARRVFVGRDRAKAAELDLADVSGRVRLRLRVDSLGTPSIDFLDENGRVVNRVTDGRRRQAYPPH